MDNSVAVAALGFAVPEVDQVAITSVVESNDPKTLDSLVRTSSNAWAAFKALALIACWRMKKLFVQPSTRKEAVDTLGWSSWSEWVNDAELPMASGTIRERVMDIEAMVRQGCSWLAIARSLAFTPTATRDVFDKLVGPNGTVNKFIDPALLPPGGIPELIEELSSLPPGQARKRVSEIAGEMSIHAVQIVGTPDMVLAKIRIELPDGDAYVNLAIGARDDNGEVVAVEGYVQRWLASRLGAPLEPA